MTKSRASQTQYTETSRMFAALGDATRLALVSRLARGQALSVSQLADGTRLTRQAVSKHLGILRAAGLVACTKAGREARYQFDFKGTAEMRQYLDFVTAQWEVTSDRHQREF